MNIKYILEQERNFVNLYEAVLMLSGVECYNIADMETGELIIKGATAQDILALGEHSVYGVRLTNPYGDICATLFVRFYGNEAEELKNYSPNAEKLVNYYHELIETK